METIFLQAMDGTPSVNRRQMTDSAESAASDQSSDAIADPSGGLWTPGSQVRPMPLQIPDSEHLTAFQDLSLNSQCLSITIHLLSGTTSWPAYLSQK